MNDDTKNLIRIKTSDICLALEECLPEKKLRQFIKNLSPKAVGHDLIRIGCDTDGGYLIPDDLEGIQACFSSYGTENSSFEKMLVVRYGIKPFIVGKQELTRVEYLKQFISQLLYSTSAEEAKVECFKRFISQMKTYKTTHKTFCRSLDFDLENKFIGVKNDIITTRLHDWMKKKVRLDSIGDLILRMNLDRYDPRVLKDTPSEVLKKFRIMVIRFHCMRLFDLIFFEQLEDVFNKILRDFCVAHIHPDNNARKWLYKDIEMPERMEFTFIRKDRVLPDNRKLVFPHKLDCRNNPNVPDLVLPEIWQNHKT